MFFFNRPSWLTGMARTLDIGGVFNPPYAKSSLPPRLADSMALAGDLKRIRQDMDKALDHVKDDPRTRILSDRDLVKVKIEMMRQELASHERMIAHHKKMIARRRKYYILMRAQLLAGQFDSNQQEEQATNSRPGEELSWAG